MTKQPANDNARTLAEHVHYLISTALKSVDRVFSLAEEDARAIGYREHNGRYNTSGGGGGKSSPTETAAEQLLERGDEAAKWINDVTAAAKTLHHLSTQGAHRWPPTLRAGEEHDGVKVGARANTVETCHHCGEPVPEIRLANGQPAIIRLDGRPYHRSTCYRQLLRAGQKAS